MKKLLIIIAILLTPVLGFSATYYVDQSGNGDADGTSYVNRMSAATHNSGSFSPGDTIYLCDTITTELYPPSDGSSGNYVTYRGDYADHAGIVNTNGDYGIRLDGRDYIIIDSVTVTNSDEGIMTLGSSDYITIKSCEIYNITNRGIHITYSATYYGGDDPLAYNSYITIGGADGDGNDIHDNGINSAGADIQINKTSNFVVSYNKMYATSTSWGIDGMFTHYASYGLIEYNKIYDHNKTSAGEDGLDIKQYSNNIIIRFNDIYGHPQQTGITVQMDSHDIYIYGNNIYGADTGILIFDHSTSDFDNCDGGSDTVENIYVWGNVVRDNTAEGIWSAAGYQSGTCAAEDPNNVKIYNNVLADNTSYGLRITAGTNYGISNNILYNNDDAYIQAYTTEALTTLDYDTYYYPSQTSLVYYSGGNRTIAVLQSSYSKETNGNDTDPGFTNAAGDDFTLDGTHIDNGGDLGSATQWSVTVQGVTYQIGPAIGLDPNLTNWTTTPPTVATLDRDSRGPDWNRGAYVYTADTYYVTQAGAGTGTGLSLGDAMSAADFNGLEGDASGITFYFSGTITTRIESGVYGTVGSVVTIDGYESGSCDPVNDDCASGALLSQGIEIVGGVDYITVQDFRMTGGPNDEGCVQVNNPTAAGRSDYITIQNCYLYSTSSRAIFFGRTSGNDGTQYATIQDIKLYGYGFSSDAAAGITMYYVDDWILQDSDIANAVGTTNTSGNNISVLSSAKGLVENNYIHDSLSQAGIAIKEGGVGNQDIIVRFNRFEDNGTKADEARGMYLGGSREENETSGIYIYANNVYGSEDFGMDSNDAIHDLYVWSNLIHNNEDAGWVSWYRAGLGHYQDNINIYNNTIYNNASIPALSNRSGLTFTEANMTNVTIKNNIVVDNRPNESDYIQLYIGSTGLTGDIDTDYNTYYFTGQTAGFYYDGATKTLAQMQGYGLETNSSVDTAPGFTDAKGADNTDGTVDDDYTLDGTHIDNGGDLGGTTDWSVTVQGVIYYMGPAIGLDPNNTNWTTTPPTVATLDQDSNGSWERGAYVYPVSTQTVKGVTIK